MLKVCRLHGNLSSSQVIKAKFNAKGERTYRCKKCMSESHKRHYEKNKEKVLAAHRSFIERNPDKAREQKNASSRRMRALHPEREKQRKVAYERRKPEMKKARQKRFKEKQTQNLSDGYVKQQLVANTSLKHADIPDTLVKAKRAMMLLRRGIKAKQEEEARIKRNEIEKHQ